MGKKMEKLLPEAPSVPQLDMARTTEELNEQQKEDREQLLNTIKASIKIISAAPSAPTLQAVRNEIRKTSESLQFAHSMHDTRAEKQLRKLYLPNIEERTETKEALKAFGAYLEGRIYQLENQLLDVEGQLVHIHNGRIMMRSTIVHLTAVISDLLKDAEKWLPEAEVRRLRDQLGRRPLTQEELDAEKNSELVVPLLTFTFTFHLHPFPPLHFFLFPSIHFPPCISSRFPPSVSLHPFRPAVALFVVSSLLKYLIFAVVASLGLLCLRCGCELTHHICCGCVSYFTSEESQKLLDQTSAARLITQPPDFSGINDLTEILAAATSGQLLTIRELCTLRRTLTAARELFDHLKHLDSAATHPHSWRHFTIYSLVHICIDRSLRFFTSGLSVRSMEDDHDRSWMYNRLTDRRQLTRAFLEGLETFIQFALEQIDK
ncbi:uncharacterized protein LOC133294654 [Gastrolobium bilobum]|uniref:uncharacterized protein LOC133294654 n=1 Tax=Gastrolobium bilobum TaxID=150636 RepID=UPI002AAFFE53|nr:uncharacterized protein LOC133294654 [Gastrolobium bilobum]